MARALIARRETFSDRIFRLLAIEYFCLQRLVEPARAGDGVE